MWSLLKNKVTTKENLMLHFGYHKAMTVFFRKVFSDVASKYGWHQKHHRSRINDFYEDIEKYRKSGTTSIISINNKKIDLDSLPTYIGTHIVRDPRDLLVSSYRYHLWCSEKWIKKPMDQARRDLLCLEELGLTEQAKGKSYQELLNSVSKIEGYKLELNSRRPAFQQMFDWNYANPRILEIRYENIFGNEEEIFAKIFTHYGLPVSEVNQLRTIVNKHSFKSLKQKQATGKQQHAEVGSPSQWKTYLPLEIQQEFQKKYGKLLIKLGYEKNDSWVA